VSKMSGQARKKWYEYLTKRDGEFCKFCKITSKEVQLVIDHIDNNNSNNGPKNFQLLCRRCNHIKNQKRVVAMCVNENETQNEMSELEINKTKEPQFKKYVAQQVNENGSVQEKDLINSSAEVLSLSPMTTKRYLDKICSSEGIYQRVKRVSDRIIKYKDELAFT